MTTPADWTDELRTLCDLLIDDTLSDEQQARLERLVLQNPAARKWYTEYLHQNACLAWSAMEPSLLALPTPQLHEPAKESQQSQLVGSFRHWRAAQ